MREIISEIYYKYGIRSYLERDVPMFAPRLRPWGGNLGKRLVKSPKVYVCDSGQRKQAIWVMQQMTVIA